MDAGRPMPDEYLVAKPLEPLAGPARRALREVIFTPAKGGWLKGEKELKFQGNRR